MAHMVRSKACWAKAVSLSKVMDLRSAGSTRANTASMTEMVSAANDEVTLPMAALGSGVDLLGPFVDGDAILDGISRRSRPARAAASTCPIFRVFHIGFCGRNASSFPSPISRAKTRWTIGETVQTVDELSPGYQRLVDGSPWRSIKDARAKVAIYFGKSVPERNMKPGVLHHRQ